MVNKFPIVRGMLLAALLAGSFSLAGVPDPSQQAAAQEPSLGEKARELRAKASSEGKKPAKVYTNDDLRAQGDGISILGGGSSVPTESLAAVAGGKREQDYHHEMTALQDRLDLHQRQLKVLQQKLSINQLQYYADPYKTLQQEYSRSDINKLQQEIEAKTDEVKADEQAITDLQTEVRRNGGDAGRLRPGPEGQTASGKQTAEQPEETVENPKAKAGTREYWQSRFKSARAKVAKAQEKQQLAEDELNLLQVQQAREVLNTNVAAELGPKITAKQAEVESARAATHEAELALEALQQEFASGGAPEEWSEEQ